MFEDPATFARTAFIEALGRAGVTVGGDPMAKNSTASLGDQAAVDALPSVAELESLPLRRGPTYVMKISYNRGAQTTICLLAVDRPAATSANDGLARSRPRSGRRPVSTPRALRSIDGSGLDGNFVTAEEARPSCR